MKFRDNSLFLLNLGTQGINDPNRDPDRNVPFPRAFKETLHLLHTHLGETRAILKRSSHLGIAYSDLPAPSVFRHLYNISCVFSNQHLS
jgi:hypothetical protein